MGHAADRPWSDGNERVRYYGIIYELLAKSPPTSLLIAAVAALRLLLIGEVGEQCQADLIGAWNERLGTCERDPADDEEEPFERLPDFGGSGN